MFSPTLRHLQLIPRRPKKIDVQTLHEKLEHRGFSITLRTVQRDLVVLSTAFPLTSDDARPAGWSWTADPIQLPALDPQVALTFKLVEQFVRPLLVCTLWAYEDIRQLALRRMRQAVLARRSRQ